MKRFDYKVFDVSGNYIKNWTNEVVSEPRYAEQINSPASEMVIRLARSPLDYGEEEDVKFNNIVEVYIDDLEASNVLFYRGYIADYTPVFDDKGYIEITLLSFGAELSGFVHGEDEIAEQSQATGSSEYNFGGSTSLAQSFVPTETTISSVDLKMYSSYATDVTLSIQTDSSGSPSGSVVTNAQVTKQITNTTAEVVKFVFTDTVTLTAGTTYWLVLQS